MTDFRVMSRRILNAHTGECLFVDLDAFEAFEDLKHWVAEATGIAEKRQVLLTPRGKQAKLQTLRNEEDIFVYDIDLVQGSSRHGENPTTKNEHLDFSDPSPPPGQPADHGDIQAWLEAAQARIHWSAQFEELCKETVDTGRRLATEVAIIQQGTAIAVDNLKQHLASIQQRHRQAKDWVESLLVARDSFEEERGTLESRLSAVPAAGQLQRFLKEKSPSQRNIVSLLDLLGSANLDDLSSRATAVSQKLKGAIDSIGNSVVEASEKGEVIVQGFSQDFLSSTGDLLETLDSNTEEQGVLCRKINDDCANILRVGNSDPTQISKAFTRHDRNIFPALLSTLAEIKSVVVKILERKQQITDDALVYMQRISGAESLVRQISQSFGRLELNADDDATLESLDTIYRLPFAYGSLLVEVARRREWTEKMTSDSTSLAEEMATYRDEEERRRKKWFKSVEHFVGSELSGDVMGIDVSVRMAGDSFPHVTREEIAGYVDALKRIGGFDEAVRELSTQFKALDAPSKQQSRRANAFRTGSVNDSPFGRNSLLLRGDDDLIRSLQVEKTRLEERLKGSDSRVRKLEDLLHRQSHIQSRPSSRGTGITFPYDRQVTTPVNLDGFSKVPVHPQSPGPYGSRQSSLVAQFQEQNPLVERLAHLESELSSEKAKTARLEELMSKNLEKEESLRIQMQEANSMKQDLMDNFQSQQNEFEGERRLLEDENRKLKVKLEELEEDFDRILGSHDNARLGLDERTQNFEQELRNHRERAAEDANRMATENQKLRDDQEQLRQELEAAQKNIAASNALRENTEKHIQELQATIQTRDKSQTEHQRTLRTVHAKLSSEEPSSVEFGPLIGMVEQLSIKAANHLQELQQALERTKTENSAQAKQLEARAVENRNLKSRFDQEELEVFSLREEVADRKARYASLETELEDQRQELENMRIKCTQNETLVGTLRDRLGTEERKTAGLDSELSTVKSRHTQAENHLSRLNERINILESVRNKQTAQLEAKAKRAEDVSSRLHRQNELLLKLLSQVGFTATRQGGAYAFERTSRLANGSSSMIDPSPVASRAPTGNLDPEQNEEQTPSFLRWATVSDDSNIEREAFQKYIAEIEALKMDVVFETLVKRFKDIEHTARKWQREAKNYRERFHRSQFEAQNKIAFRSFREGDLALFLPTRNQAPKRSWAAFNVGAPHYFLREQEHHILKSRDWLVARISRVEEKVVDLSRSVSGDATVSKSKEGAAAGDDSNSITAEDDNPFGLSDGLRWYYLDAAEERLGAAPSTPGLGKSTIASAPEHATGSSILASKKKPGEVNAAAKVLTKSLDSRRSSTNSKKSTAGALATTTNATGTFETGHGEGGGAAAAAANAAGSVGLAPGLAADRASDRSSLRRPGSRGSRESMAHATAAQQHQQQQQQQQQQPSTPQQQEPRREHGWSSLWSVDVNLESGRKDGPK